jgi:hypothetical protein
MKKSLIIALGAIALVACTKTSVSYEQTGEIGFAPVVRKNSTKAAVQSATFPEQNIMVFGYYDNSTGPGKHYADGNFADAYLPGVQFAKNGAIWAGANNNHYYWPKTGSMLFAGYSPVDFAGVTFNLASNTFSVAECPQPEFSATATKDLLYAGYTTSVLGGTVDMAFSHALSWVTVKAKAAAADQIKITNIKFVGLAAKAFSAGLPEWTVSGTKEQLNVFAPTSAFAVPDAETLVESHENCGLVFPQNLTDAAEIEVSYQMNNGAGQWFAQAPFVQKLNSLKSGDDKINKWEAGKHYTYVINFSAIGGEPGSSNEITISPTVNKWTPVNADGISAN